MSMKTSFRVIKWGEHFNAFHDKLKALLSCSESHRMTANSNLIKVFNGMNECRYGACHVTKMR